MLIAAAAVITIAGAAHPGPSAVAWAGRLSMPEILGLGAGVLVLALVSGQTWMFVHVLRQNGRLLLRVDALEAALAGVGLRAGAVAGPSRPDVLRGLPMGTPAPPFALERLGGGTSAIGELLSPGMPLALAFVDPQCGPCTALLPEFAEWEQELADRITLVLVSGGTSEANEAKFGSSGLRHVLLQKDREISEAYQAYGTPAMVLVGSDGSIGSPVIGGRDAIRALMARVGAAQAPLAANGHRELNVVAADGNGAHHGAHSNGHSRIGEAAPAVSLSDLDGKQTSLSALPSLSTRMLLFWNPGCHFCQGMLDDLKAWEASRSVGSSMLLLVSTGSVEANRALGLRSTILLDAGFETGRAFGASGTPSAVLVDEHGRLASEIAVGSAAVMALATRQPIAAEAGV